MTNTIPDSQESTESEVDDKFENLNNYTHNEIMKIYEYLDSLDKKMASFQKVMSPHSIDEIHERLDKIESQLKEQNDKILNNSDINDIKAELQELKQQTNLKNNDVKCLKYEVKLLKRASNNNQNNDVQTRAVPLTDVTPAPQEDEKLKEQVNSLNNTLNQLRSDVRCLKYEVKRIKDTPASTPVPLDASPVDEESRKQIQKLMEENNQMKDQVNTLQSDVDKLKEQPAPVAQERSVPNDVVEGLVADNKNLKNDVGCLKYEVKKLKEQPAVTPMVAPVVEERAAPAIPDDLVERVDNAQQQSAKALDATQQIEALKNDVGCLKYEVKKLKEQPAVTPMVAPVVEERAAPAIPDEFIQQIKDANEKVDRACQDIDGLKKQTADTSSRVDAMVADNEAVGRNIRCLKYEVKRMKEQPVVAPAPVEKAEPAPVVIPDEFIQQIKDANDKADRACQDVDGVKKQTADTSSRVDAIVANNEAVGRNIRCLKYEVKRMKEQPTVAPAPVVEERAVPAIPDDLVERVDNAQQQSAKALDATQQIDALKNDVGCLKYEVKKLKQAPAVAPAPVVEERAVPAIPDDLVERVDNAQQQSTKASEAADDAHQQIAALKEENEALKTDVKCLKYEVKKLKEVPPPEPAPVVEERSVPTIPDDLVERVDNAQQQSAKALDATQQIEAMRNDIGCLKYEVKKLKQAPAVAPAPVERAEPAPVVIPDEFIQQIKDANDKADKASQDVDAVKQQATETSEKVDKASQDIDGLKQQTADMNGRVDAVVADNKSVHDDVKCLKYEVKKLKEAPTPEPAPVVEERAVPAIPDDLVERVDNAQQQSAKALDATQQIDALKNDVGCLKYEVKKLKQAPAVAPAPVEERAIPEIPDDLVERVDNAQQQSTKASEAADDAHQQIAALKEENEALKTDVKCLKYEVKKLKEVPPPEPAPVVEERSVPTIPDDLVERVDNAQQQSTKANEAADDAHQQIKALKNDIGCLKYEVKKLKEAPAVAPAPVERAEPAPVVIPDEFIQQIKDANDKSDKANEKVDKASQDIDAVKQQATETSEKVDKASQDIDGLKKQNEDMNGRVDAVVADNKAVHNDVKCLKYEVKKLKEAPTPEPAPVVEERAVPVIPDDLVERVDNAQQQSTKATKDAEDAHNRAEDAAHQIETLKEENEDMKSDIKCLKYEVKKLKDAPAPLAAPVDERAIPEIPDDLVERVDNAQQQSTKATTAADDAHQKVEEANQRIEDLKKENETLKADMKCMKYEVKKLKDAPPPEPVEKEAPPVVIPDEFIQQIKDANDKSDKANEKVDKTSQDIEAVRKQAQEANDKADKLKEDNEGLHKDVDAVKDQAQAANDKADQVKADNEGIHKDMKCMKYEVKKLKDAPAPEPVQERAGPVIPDDLVERVDNAEQQSTKASKDVEDTNTRVDDTQKKLDEANKRIDRLKQDNDALKADMKCMKYEVKKIKDTPAPEPVQERDVPVIPDDLVERVDNAEQQSTKASKDVEDTNTRVDDAQKRLDDAQKKLDDANKKIEKLKKDNDNLKEDMKCMKYEVKKLKDTPAPTPVEAAPVEATLPDDMVKRINKASIRSHHASKHCRQLDAKAGQVDDKLATINRDMKCMKYEIKKLKDAPAPEPVHERAAPVPEIPDDLVDKVDKASSRSQHASKMVKDVETKTNDLSSKVDEMKADNDKLRADNRKMNDDIKCMKYEIKKLKDAPAPEPVEKEREAPQPAVIPDEFIQQIKTANDKSDKAAQKADKVSRDIEDLKNKTDETNSKVNKLVSGNKTINEDMKCMKYEVKKIKEEQDKQPKERAAPAPVAAQIPDDLEDKIKDAQSQSAKAYEKATKAHRDISEMQTHSTETNDKIEKLAAENQSMKEDMKCMKYEVKKLKESKQSETGKRSSGHKKNNAVLN